MSEPVDQGELRGRAARVVADYDAPYADPLRGRSGDRVSIDREKKTTIEGWLWCTDPAGRSGWVPEAYLEAGDRDGALRRDYDAIELTVRVGEGLAVHYEESGFYWVTHADGRQGWVPTESVRLLTEVSG
ncbi:MAG: hypothetical protein JSW65_03260 [Candidatus Bipolaricaulota bacterium]|nr:MAG: hypothetical protein JSW65_03260 [Candidatus Bipolaricaulota bacterium]